MERPLTSDCDSVGVCVDGEFIVHEGITAESTILSCKCGGGGWDIFVGWNQKEVYLALALFVVYSWLTGIVVKQFSSIHRSIADGFSLLLIYFVLDPLVRGKDWSNWALDLMALIMPLSIVTFSCAASEMERVMEQAHNATAIRRQLSICSNLSNLSDFSFPSASPKIQVSEKSFGPSRQVSEKSFALEEIPEE